MQQAMTTLRYWSDPLASSFYSNRVVGLLLLPIFHRLGIRAKFNIKYGDETLRRATASQMTILRPPVMFALQLLSILAIALAVLLVSSARAFAEELITIYNGAGTNSDKHFVDVKFYPIERGKKLTWFSEDYLDHWLTITDENGATVADSGPIGSRESFSISFNETGSYRFYSVTQPEVEGTVLVSDDIVTMTADYLENPVDVQMSWTPATPKIGETAYFKTIFIDKESRKNQEHVDYELSITDSGGNTVYPQTNDHVLNGIQVTPYTFGKEDSYSVKATVRGIFFVPTFAEDASFALVTTPEFLDSAIATLSISSLAIILTRFKLRNR